MRLSRLTLLVDGYNKSQEGDFNVITTLEVAAISHRRRGASHWGSAGAVGAGKHPQPEFPRLAEGFGKAVFNFNGSFAVSLD